MTINMPRRSGAIRKAFLMTLAAGLCWMTPLAQAMELRLGASESRLVSLAGQPATVIVGNPLYADVTVLGGKVVVQGRAPGATNITILDSDGQRLASLDVVITNDSANRLHVYNGGNSRLTYACTPHCERVLTVGDDYNETTKLASQMQTVISAVKSGMDMNR